MNNQECKIRPEVININGNELSFYPYTVYINECSDICNSKIRPEIIHINSNEPSFYTYSVNIYKFSGICNNINDSYVKLCVPDIIKNINIKVFNLMSRTNETRYIEWHETCKCKSRLDTSVCSNKQRCNNGKCRY